MNHYRITLLSNSKEELFNTRSSAYTFEVALVAALSEYNRICPVQADIEKIVMEVEQRT